MRIALGVALAFELIGLAYGVGSLAVVVGVADPFAPGALAMHAVLGTLTVSAVLLVRKAPWVALVIALGPIAAACFLATVTSFGFSYRPGGMRLISEAVLQILSGVTVHALLAGLACAVVLGVLLFGLFRRGSAEAGRPLSNGGPS
jgi:hypothetical protein